MIDSHAYRNQPRSPACQDFLKCSLSKSPSTGPCSEIHWLKVEHRIRACIHKQSPRLASDTASKMCREGADSTGCNCSIAKTSPSRTWLPSANCRLQASQRAVSVCLMEMGSVCSARNRLKLDVFKLPSSKANVFTSLYCSVENNAWQQCNSLEPLLRTPFCAYIAQS